MIAKDLVTDGFIFSHSSTLAHIDAVAPIKLVPLLPSASDSNDWRMVLHQGIEESRPVLRDAHRLQRTELLQKLRDRCRERMGRPGEREIQELMGKRVKKDAPDYRAFRNPAKNHPNNLCGRLSCAKWSCWLNRDLGDEVDQCLHKAWSSDEEWDGVDDQQRNLHRYSTDHTTIQLSWLAPGDLRVRISPMHLLTDLMEQRSDIDARNTFTSINPINRNCDMTRTQCVMRNVFLLRML